MQEAYVAIARAPIACLRGLSYFVTVLTKTY